mgnify:CR=1 FL=1
MEARIGNQIDNCTRALPDSAACTHLSLTWDVDFEAHVLRGRAEWTVKLASAEVAVVVLDTKSLDISEVTIGGKAASYTLGDEHEAFGKALTVELPDEAKQGAEPLKLVIAYSTTPQSSALQWLAKELTAGQLHPYLFTQCEPIHARALLPCQDTPSAKFSYEAAVTVPGWATALMSAIGKGSKRKAEGGTTFYFEQKVVIPAYLLCLAVGQLQSRVVGPRTSVWSEPSVVDAAAHEFGQTEEFISTAERIMGQPYVWERYDILCLPPSFPFGGMENPCLTFVTPTLLAGDRSLANVVAHEVAHSWTGNLITNHTWEHFWLNEGWTVWLERKIKAAMAGAKTGGPPDMTYYDFDAISGWKHLADDVKLIGETHPFTSLSPPLHDKDPDDAFSSVPYEKGFNLLNYLSGVVGGHVVFEEFARAYCARFMYATLTTADFKAFFCEWCGGRGIDCAAVDWETWLTAAGMPPVTPQFNNVHGERCVRLAEMWLAGGDATEGCDSSDVAGWSSPHFISFLEHLLSKLGEEPALAAKLPLPQLQRMDGLYGFTPTKNSEVRFRWQRLCILLRAEFIVPHVVTFLKEQGRMKFVRPLYRDLFGWEAQRAVATATFIDRESNYHPICAKMLKQDLKLA